METLPTPYCCDPCVPTGTSSTPGPQGTQGVAGTNGTNGLNAYATAVGDEAMPNDDGASSVTIATSTDTSWMAVGQVVFVQFWGYMRVTAKPTTTSVTLLNLADGTLYADNSAPGTLLTAGARISPGGWQGPAGVVPGGVLLSANNLNDVASAATSRTNLGLGSVATFTQGVANGQILVIHDAGGIGAGEFTVGTGLGVEGLTAVQTRTALGLGTAALVNTGVADNEVLTVDDAAGLTAGEVLFATASGAESLSASAARVALGVNTSAMLLFRQQEASGTDGGDFNSGGWQTVPINTEVVDTGGNGSIAANQITLAAGTYRYSFCIIGNNVNNFQARIWNVTDGAVVADSYSTIGFSGVTGDDDNQHVHGTGRFTLASGKTLRVEAQCDNTNAGDGFGAAAGYGVGEVYSWIELIKE